MRRTLLTQIVILAILAVISSVSVSESAERDITLRMHFSPVSEAGWETTATGTAAIFYRCLFQNGVVHVTYHEIVLHGFGVTEESADGFPFPVRFFGTDGYGFVVRLNPHAYGNLVPDSSFDYSKLPEFWSPERFRVVILLYDLESKGLETK